MMAGTVPPPEGYDGRLEVAPVHKSGLAEEEPQREGRLALTPYIKVDSRKMSHSMKADSRKMSHSLKADSRKMSHSMKADSQSSTPHSGAGTKADSQSSTPHSGAGMLAESRTLTPHFGVGSRLQDLEQ